MLKKVSTNMFSGSDSTESQNYTQWALNPTNYQNVNAENVDWAALAQQWIIMKEAGPPVPDQMPKAPPAPSITNKSNTECLNEGGEAPMDVELDKSDSNHQWSDGSDSQSWNWQQNQPQSWGWGNSWSVPAAVPPPNNVKPPLLPTPSSFNQYRSSNEPPIEPNPFPGYTTAPPEYTSPGYWTSNNAKTIKPHNKRYSKVNVPLQPKPVMLDAAKRKQLPAWIREGLEKMEREKQKQIDKLRENQEKQEYEEKMRLSEKETMEIIKSTVKEAKSKFDSDDENSENETDGKPLTPEPILLTQEELMMKVRRTMTEILLKVTNREINNICKEELQRHIRKNRASDRHVTAPTGANLSAKLGLGVYGGSGSSSEESDDENAGSKDSDSELKDIIKKRKAEFSKTEREIEERLAESEAKEEEQNRAGLSPDHSDDSHSQVDAKNSGRKSRFRSSPEETPPPKLTPNHSQKHKTHKVSSDDSESEKYKSRRKRTSSSSSSDSSRRRSRSSSVTKHSPDKRQQKTLHKSDSSNGKSRYDQKRKRSRSKSPSKRKRSRSPSSHRSSKRGSKRSRSSSRSRRSYSRSPSRHRTYSYRSNRSRSRSRTSNSKSKSRDYRRRSRSRRSRSRSSHRRRRSRSYSSGRGSRSHRY